MNAQFNASVDNACLGAGSRFYYGLDNATPNNTLNLLVVVLHEIGHGLGSASYADEVSGNFQNNVPDIWARFMFDSALFWDSASIRVAAPGCLNVAAAANSSFGLRVTDAAGAVSESTVSVDVSANTAPTLNYPSVNLAFGGNLTVNPSAGPSDNGSAAISIAGGGTYTGGASVSATGVVNLNTAQPAGNTALRCARWTIAALPTTRLCR